MRRKKIRERERIKAESQNWLFHNTLNIAYVMVAVEVEAATTPHLCLSARTSEKKNSQGIGRSGWWSAFGLVVPNSHNSFFLFKRPKGRRKRRRWKVQVSLYWMTLARGTEECSRQEEVWSPA